MKYVNTYEMKLWSRKPHTVHANAESWNLCIGWANRELCICGLCILPGSFTLASPFRFLLLLPLFKRISLLRLEYEVKASADMLVHPPMQILGDADHLRLPGCEQINTMGTHNTGHADQQITVLEQLNTMRANPTCHT